MCLAIGTFGLSGFFQGWPTMNVASGSRMSEKFSNSPLFLIQSNGTTVYALEGTVFVSGGWRGGCYHGEPAQIPI